MNQDHPQISPTSPINLAHVSENKFNGWGVADLVDKDYIRITASFEKNWRKSMINAEQFSFCSSYPKFLYVPSNVHDNVLIQVAGNE